MRSLWLSALVLLLAGCTVLPRPPAQDEPEPVRPDPPVVNVPQPLPPGDVQRLLAYFQRLRELPAPSLIREIGLTRKAFGVTGSDFDRVRHALTLAVPNRTSSDEARALDLLDPVLRDPDAELHLLAVLLAVYLQESRRLQAGVQTLQQDVKGLQGKLEALRKLERSLIERDPGAKLKR